MSLVGRMLPVRGLTMRPTSGGAIGGASPSSPRSVSTITFGVVYSFSVFYASLQETFQVSTEAVSLLFSGNVFLLYVVAMVGGFFADRYRPTALMAVGTLCWCIGLSGAAHADTYLEIVVPTGMGAIGCGTCYVTVYATVARWFYERRGLAMGISQWVSGSGRSSSRRPPRNSSRGSRGGLPTSCSAR